MHFGFSFCILLLAAITPSYGLDGEVKSIFIRNPAPDDLMRLAARDPESLGPILPSDLRGLISRTTIRPPHGPMITRSPLIAGHHFSRGSLVRRGCASSKGCGTGSPGGSRRQPQQQQRQQQQSQPQTTRSRGASPISSLSRASSSHSADGSHYLVSVADVNLQALIRGSPSWDQRMIRAGSVRPGQVAGLGTSQLEQHNSGQSTGSRADNSGQTVNSVAASLPSRPETPRK